MVVTDRWQKFTNLELNLQLLKDLSAYCAEFLIHAVDVEGKANGIEEELVCILGEYDGIPVTYAGGVHTLDELKKLKEAGHNRVHVTIGSALDLFGGPMDFEQVLTVISH